jgi:hypothetical protein
MRSTHRLLSIVLLAALTAACSKPARTPAAGPSSPPRPTVTPTAEPSPAVRTEAWVLFQRRDSNKGDGESLIGYFRRRLTDGKEEPIAIAPSGARRSWYPSPDGRMIAFVEESRTTDRLYVAQVDELPALREIKGPPARYSSVLWGPKNETLFSITYEPRDTKEPPESGVERLFQIPVDGSERHLITKWDILGGYTYRELAAHDAAAGTVFWTQDTREGAGGNADLYATSIATGTTRKLFAFDTTGGNGFTITADGSRAYYVKDGRRLIEGRTADRTERTVYAADGKTESGVESIHVTPDGSRLLFQGTGRPEFGNEIQTPRPRTTTYVLEIATSSRAAVHTEEHAKGRSNKHTARPSLDASFVWLFDGSSDQGSSVLLEVATGRKDVVQETTTEKPVYASFVAWMNVSA